MRTRNPFRTMTPALKYKEALEDLIDEASAEGVFLTLPEIECCCGFHDAPDVEIRSHHDYKTEYVDLNE